MINNDQKQKFRLLYMIFNLKFFFIFIIKKSFIIIICV
jgi:hypothetical protein